MIAIRTYEYADIKIQMASGFTEEQHVNNAQDSLHKNLLRKPYRIALLLKKVRELLD